MDFGLLIAFHAGIPTAVSQASLTLMFVVLGIIALGVGYGALAKNHAGLLQHRWSMTVATIIALIVIFLVMLPAAYNFYIDPDVKAFSQSSILTILHGILGAPAIIMGVTYAFGDLPKRTKRWMRWTIIFWTIGLILGVLLFLDMQDLLSFSGQM